MASVPACLVESSKQVLAPLGIALDEIKINQDLIDAPEIFVFEQRRGLQPGTLIDRLTAVIQQVIAVVKFVLNAISSEALCETADQPSMAGKVVIARLADQLTDIRTALENLSGCTEEISPGEGGYRVGHLYGSTVSISNFQCIELFI